MRRIVLFGATGYTGGRTAMMVARGLRPVLAGPRPGAAGALAERLGGLETARADVTDESSVAAVVRPGDVLVSTVGPFLQLGRAAVAAAVDAGAIYLDSTGEPPFIREVFERYGPEAERSGRGAAHRVRHDYVPGVLAGAMALRAAGGAAARVDVGYFILGGGRGQAVLARHAPLGDGHGAGDEPRLARRRAARPSPQAPGSARSTWPADRVRG